MSLSRAATASVTAASLSVLVEQAIHSGDDKMLEQVLNENAHNIVSATVEKVSFTAVVPFLKKVQYYNRFSGHHFVIVISPPWIVSLCLPIFVHVAHRSSPGQAITRTGTDSMDTGTAKAQYHPPLNSEEHTHAAYQTCI